MKGRLGRTAIIKHFLLVHFTLIFIVIRIHAQNDSLNNNDLQTWGAINPGKGFTLAKTKFGVLNISGYMLARYVNQLPGAQEYKDHLGNPQQMDGRNDILWHRVQAFIQGWIYDPRLNYMITLWTVNATNQVAVAGSMSFHFNKYFNLTAGINALPGTRSLEGSHPYLRRLGIPR